MNVALESYTNMNYKIGDRVKVAVYGVDQTGTVSRDQAAGIVFVTMDATKREKWFHAESLMSLAQDDLSLKAALARDMRRVDD